MRMFYFDDYIDAYEKELNFYPIIVYLEKHFKKSRDIVFLTTLIGSSWYYLVEGSVNQDPVDYDWRKFLAKWKEYADLSLKEYFDNEYVCFILGYTLYLHGIYIDVNYEEKGKELIERCHKISTTKEIKILSDYLYLESKERKKINQYDMNEACYKLFPTTSILDSYFKMIFLNRIN